MSSVRRKAGRGRPPIIATPEKFEERAEAYFESGEPLTVTGLALAVGLASRRSLLDYESRPEFSHAVKRAKLRVENAYEKRLLGNNPTGAIFALKNMGWSDRQAHAHTGKDGGPVECTVTRRIVHVQRPSPVTEKTRG